MLKKPLLSSSPLIRLSALALLLILVLLNLSMGSVSIPFPEVLKTLTGKSLDNPIWENIIIRTRLPQTLVALGAGMALGVSGLLMQTLFRNPLAGPSVLGISSGASLGVAVVVLLAGQAFGFTFSRMGAWGDLAIVGASLSGAMGVLVLILFISRKIGGTMSVLIMGVMIGYLSNSLVGILKYYSSEANLQNYVIWGLGSFNRLSLPRAILFSITTVVLSLLSVLLSKPLNLLSLGDYYAKNLGLKIGRARNLIIVASGLFTALVTAFCGPIAFIGLAVPHMAKMISHTSNHVKLIINTCILGAITALLCNLVARMPGIEGGLPINSVTAFIGAPVVISVIWKKRRES